MKDNPKLYRELCEPHASHDTAEAAFRAFVTEVYALRKKHRIPDVALIGAYYQTEANGTETRAAQMAAFGDSSKHLSMVAVMFGFLQADHAAELRQLASGKVSQ